MNILAAAVFIVFLILPGCSGGEPPPPPPLDAPPGVFTSAERCGECHTDIYRVWTSSLHAASFTNETFQASLRELTNGKEALSSVCMGCHAPVTATDVAREGVTCDYCHSIQNVDVKTRPIQAVLSVGKTKFGPVSNAHSTGHEVAVSPLHAESAICSGCHEYQNPAGLQVLGTFSEWQASDMGAAGMTCQRCHMPLTGMKVVDPRVKREPASFVNLHKMPGAHSKDQLSKALEFQIVEVRREGVDLHIRVMVRNHGAGHNVPTGMPTRAIVLTAETTGNRSGVQRQMRTYGTSVVDAAGRRLEHDSQIMISGAKLATDTRLRPSEQRREDFTFRIAADENVDINITLTYRYSPFGDAQPSVDFEFAGRRQQSIMRFVGKEKS